MNRPPLCRDVRTAFLLLAMLLPFAEAPAQIAPGTPSKEYIRLADRLVAIEHFLQPGSLPSGLASTPINSACSLNGATYSNGVFTVAGTGAAGLGGVSGDSFEFAAVPVTGDVTIIGRMPTSLSGALSGTAAIGLMLRTNLTATSPFALSGFGRSNIYSYPALLFKKRTTTGTGASDSYSSSLLVYPQYWFKLERAGTTITAYRSGNGIDWEAFPNPLTGITAPTIYAGLAVANATSDCTTGNILRAGIDNVVISTGPDFFLTTVPNAVNSSAAGETNTYTIGVNPLYGMNSPVSLQAAGLPSGMSWTFSPSTVAPPGNAILAITAPPGTPPGDYPFTIHSSGGGKTHTNYATFAVTGAAGGGLASGWRTTAFSNTCSWNAASSANGVFTVTGTGGKLSNAPDGVEFVYVPVSGDVTIVARMPSFPLNLFYLGGEGGAGLLLKKDLSAGSDYAFVGVSNNSYLAWNLVLRKRTGGPGQASTSTWGDAYQYWGYHYGPFWFKLVRSGSTVTGYRSLNGVDWTQLGTAVTGFTQTTLYVGMAVTSGVTNCTSQYAVSAPFDQVSLSGGTGGGTPDFSIGVSSDVPSVNAGGSLNMTTLVTASGGFSENVEFSVSDLPEGSDGLFDPPTMGGQGTSNLLITTSPSLTMPGSYSPTVTGDSASLSRSAIATFTVDPPPTEPPSASVSPASGSGTSQTFTLTATEPSGAENVRWLQFLINDTLSSQWACYLHYDVASNELYLRDDTDPSWAGSKQVGTAGTIANGQCTVDAGASSFSAPTGITATLNLAIAFKAAFAGDKTTYGLVDSGNWNSGWEALGAWTAVAPAGSLPNGWTSTNLAVNTNGNCPTANYATYANDTFTLTGTGGYLWNPPDGFELVHTQVTGDVTITAKVPSALTGSALAVTNGGVGIMLRLGPTSNAPYAMVGVGNNGSNKLMFRTRTTITGTPTATYGASFSAPYWFKLVRSGNSITGWTAPDSGGVPGTWTQLGTAWAIPGTPAPTTLSAGMAVTSGKTGCLATDATTATFSNVSVP